MCAESFSVSLSSPICHATPICPHNQCYGCGVHLCRSNFISTAAVTQQTRQQELNDCWLYAFATSDQRVIVCLPANISRFELFFIHISSSSCGRMRYVACWSWLLIIEWKNCIFYTRVRNKTVQFSGCFQPHTKCTHNDRPTADLFSVLFLWIVLNTVRSHKFTQSDLGSVQFDPTNTKQNDQRTGECIALHSRTQSIA